jgi:hypothetical protein
MKGIQPIIWTIISSNPWQTDRYFSRVIQKSEPNNNFLGEPIIYFPVLSSTLAKLKSKLCYDRWSVSQSVLVSSTHLGLKSRFLFLSDSCKFVYVGCTSDERMGLFFTIAADPCQCSHSQVWVPWDSWLYFTVSGLRLPQHGEPGPCIYIPHEQGGPVITQGTEFPFCRLLRLAKAMVEVFNTAPKRASLSQTNSAHIITDWIYYTTRPVQKTPHPIVVLLMGTYSLPRKRVYRTAAYQR